VTVRFLADEDIDFAIVRGLRAREPAIDILDAKTAGLRRTKDPALLELAAQQGRAVISHDRDTMTRYFCERVESGKYTPGLFIVPQEPGVIGATIESLILIWTASEPEEWRDQIVYLPFR
jgi:Domain of unknown function (DUF5615)